MRRKHFKWSFQFTETDIGENHNELNEVNSELRDCAIIIWRGGGGSKISKVGLKIKLHPP